MRPNIDRVASSRLTSRSCLQSASVIDGMHVIGESERVADRQKLTGRHERRHEKYRTLSDEGLVSALKAEESGAYLELVERYQGLAFKFARQFDVHPEQQHEWVSDLLTDVVLLLSKRGAIMPDSLAGYIAGACRNKGYMDHRRESRRQVREAPPTYEIQSSPPSDWEPQALSPALKRLVRELEELLTPEERRLLDWSSESVPLRFIAEWCGITRTGASHRINRLRQRLRRLTPGIVASFAAKERAEVERFLARANGVTNDRS